MTPASLLQTLSAVQRQASTLSAGASAWIELVQTERFEVDDEGIAYLVSEIGKLQGELICVRVSLQEMLRKGH